jgi:hypothetical protein
VRKEIRFSKNYRMHKIVAASTLNFGFFRELSGKQHLSPTTAVYRAFHAVNIDLSLLLALMIRTQ